MFKTTEEKVGGSQEEKSTTQNMSIRILVSLFTEVIFFSQHSS